MFIAKNNFRVGFSRVIISVLALLLSFTVVTTASASETEAAVSLDAPSRVYTGASFSVPVDISGVEDLNAYNFRVRFDPDQLSLTDVGNGRINGTSISTDFNEVQSGICNIVGILGGVSSVSGSGTLATLYFQAQDQTGETSISFQDGVLSDVYAQPIASGWQDADLTLVTRSSDGGSGGAGSGGTAPTTTASTTAATTAASTTPAAAENEPEPGSFDLSDWLDDQGRFKEDCTLASQNGQLTILIPAGTVGYSPNGKPLSSITINRTARTALVSEDTILFSAVFDLGPAGATFDPPVTLSLVFDPEGLPDGISETDLYLAWLDNSSGNWIALESRVEVENHLVSAPSSHFTEFAVVGRSPVVATAPSATLASAAPEGQKAEATTAVTGASDSPSQAAQTTSNGRGWIIALVVVVIVVIAAGLFWITRRRRHNPE